MNSLYQNHYIRACKKYIHDISPTLYTEAVDDLLERISPMITTQKDAEKLINLIGGLFSAGYVRATNDIQETLKADNIHLKIVSKND